VSPGRRPAGWRNRVRVMRPRRGQPESPGRRAAARGSAILYTVVLAPVLLLAMALALGVATLQLQRQRLHAVVDEAAISGAVAAASAGDVRSIDPVVADAHVRQALADNLAPLAQEIDGSSPRAIAADADVVVLTSVPATDPFDGSRVVTRPSVEVRVRVPVRAGLLALAHIGPTITLVVAAGADVRVVGIGAQ
jgi:Flp pilus assembly protein TadG